ncbi:TolC family protein [Sphingobacterium hungaricum]
MRTALIILSFLALFLLPEKSRAQKVDDYIQVGLKNNLVLAEKNLSLDKALNGLKMAKNMYLPTIGFDFTYTHADGGRSIDLPVGDMLNPVYNTLNQITQSNAFPNIANEQITFLPKHYYDAKIRTSMPLFNADIKNNKAIKEQVVTLGQKEIEIYKRELVKDIKEGYYTYMSAADAVAIHESGLQLARESKRVNEKLLDAGKGLPAYVIRADAEIAQGEAKIVEAKQQQQNAKLYFNSLLNRDPQDAIELDSTLLSNKTTVPDLNSTFAEREELDALETNIHIQELLVKMDKQVFLPKLNAFVDLGSQAEQMRVNSQSQYYLVGAQLSIPIFAGNRNKLKIQESEISVAEARNKLDQAKQQLQLAVQVASNDVIAAHRNYESSKIQVNAAATYQRLIQRGFNEGVNTYIETIDARNQYTSARLANNISTYRLLVALAKLERESAAYPLD